MLVKIYFFRVSFGQQLEKIYSLWSKLPKVKYMLVRKSEQSYIALVSKKGGPSENNYKSNGNEKLISQKWTHLLFTNGTLAQNDAES